MISSHAGHTLMTPTYRIAHTVSIALFSCATCLSFCPSEATARHIYVAGYKVGSPGLIATIFEFNDNGAFIGSFGEASGATYGSIATYGNSLLVSRTNTVIKRFSLSGTSLDDFGSPFSQGDTPWIETDAQGAVYLSKAAAIQRLNADGSIAQTFAKSTTFSAGIDADAMGNVYSLSYNTNGANAGIYKYGADGALVGFLPRPATEGPGDIAIDEKNQLLYLTDVILPDFGIAVFDISGQLPVFLNSIASPSLFSFISFDPASGNLLGTDLHSAWELTVNGDIVQRYDLPQDGADVYAGDVTVSAIPEPPCASMLWLLGVALVKSGKWRPGCTRRMSTDG